MLQQLFAISGVINALVAIGFGFLVILKNWREKVNWLFFLMTVSLFVWGAGYWQWQLADNYTDALFWIRVLSIGSLFIPIFFFHWITKFLNKTNSTWFFTAVVYLVSIVITFFFSSDIFIPTVREKMFFLFWPDAGPLYSFYLFIIYIGLVITSIYLLIKAYRTERAEDKRGQILYIIVGAILGFGGGLSNFFLWYNIPIPPYGTFLVCIFPFLFGYSIIRYKFFDVKSIAAEILVFFISIVLFVEIMLSTSTLQIILRGIFLLIVIIFGVFLVRSVYREVEQKEKIQKLAKDLAKTNSDLASANEKLKELDKQKTEFVSLASHQLRSPLTAIKGYSSMILEGDYGPLADKLKEAIGRIFESSQKLVLVIEDFLNITRIELGRIKYDLTEWSFNSLVKNVIGEQKPNIERRGLAFSYDEDAPEYKVYADQGKISQVISNLIDNSVKYTKQGSIAVKVSGVTNKDGKKCVRVTVKDTGVGVASETMPHLFQKFSRAEDASKTNIIGTGLGLYVAKQIMDAHQGKIWAESEGKGHGSTFFVELALTTGVAPVPVIPPAEQDNNPTSPATPESLSVPQPEDRHIA